MTPIQLTFVGTTADEVNDRVKDYLSKIKGSRGGKTGNDEAGATGGQTAPAPQMPPGAAPSFNPAPAFAPPGAGAGAGMAFPAAGAPAMGPAPEVLAIVQRIAVRVDGAIAAGQNAETQVAPWLRNQIGPQAAAYTLDQCKQSLVNLPMPTLENIAKLMNA